MASTSPAQTQQGVPPGTLQLIGLPPGTREAVLAAIDAYQYWSPMAAYQRVNGALSIDSTIGIARIIRADLTGGSLGGQPAGFVHAEFRRGMAQTAGRPAAEVAFALARVGFGAERNVLLGAVRALAPGDQRVALEHALSFTGNARLDSLRALASRYPTYAAPRLWLAFYLGTGTSALIVSDSTTGQALRAAEEAVNLAPNVGGTHAMLGNILVRLGRDDEALPHLAQATALDPVNQHAYQLRAEIYGRDNKPYAIQRARADFDSAIAFTPHLVTRVNSGRTRALLLVHDGNIKEALTEMDSIARHAESIEAGGAAFPIYAQMAVLAGAVRDTPAVERYWTQARRLNTSAGGLVLEVYARGLARQATPARRALEEYTRLTTNTTVAPALQRRMTGYVLLAEGKPALALAEFTHPESDDGNPYRELGMVEAYLALRNRKAADATRAAMLTRTNVDLTSIAIAIAKYNARTSAAR